VNETEDRLEALFEGMSPRAAPPEAARLKALTAAREAFEALKRRRRRRIGAAVALAASAVCAWLLTTTEILPAKPFAVELADAQGLKVNGVGIPDDVRLLEVAPGSRLETVQPVRLAFGRATDLRINGQSSLVWLDADHLQLIEGAVYVDTGGKDDMTVVTSRGTVTDIGTRFLVSMEDGALEVAMRSGRTLVDSSLGKFEASATQGRGDVLRLSDRRVTSAVERTSDDRWQWIHSVARGYESDRVAVVLEEIAADLGLLLTYVDDGTRAWVMNQQLKGESLTGLEPRKALGVVSAAADISVTEAGETLNVALR